MRPDFQLLRKYEGFLRRGADLSLESLKNIYTQILICKSFKNLEPTEEAVLASIEYLFEIRKIELTRETDEMFHQLEIYISAMKVANEISNDMMGTIIKYINVCDHLAKTFDKKDLVKQARELWTKIREKQIKELEHRKKMAHLKKYEFTTFDKRFLERENISSQDGPSERTELVKKELELEFEDKEFLKRYRIKW